MDDYSDRYSKTFGNKDGRNAVAVQSFTGRWHVIYREGRRFVTGPQPLTNTKKATLALAREWAAG